MEKERLDSVANHLIASVFDMKAFSRQFLDDYGTPPTLMAKVHYFRSAVQARLIDDEEFDLASAYVDFGRVEFVDAVTQERFLLKSSGALAVEKQKNVFQQLALFEVGNLLRPAAVRVLIYEFDKSGLNLSIASAVTRNGGVRVFVTGDPVPLGSFRGEGDRDGMSFDQDVRDPFADVGFLNEGGESEDGAP
jgi:hypothetical protein